MNSAAKTSRYSNLLAVFNVCIGVIALFLSLVFVRDILTSGHKKAGTSTPTKQTDPLFRRRNLQEYEAILKNSPFGTSPSSLVALSGSGEKASSRADITLIGTVAGEPRNSFAVFSDSTGRQEVYRVGETIPGVGKLRSVDKDKVSIRGAQNTLTIPIADIIRITEVNQVPSAIRSSDFVRNVGGGNYIVDQKKVQHAIENPNQLMTDARLQPNFTDGKQEGFTLREVKSGGIYQSLGLQNGDVLLRINEYNISNPEIALQAFTALRGMDRIQLDILRNNAKTTLTYQIK